MDGHYEVETLISNAASQYLTNNPEEIPHDPQSREGSVAADDACSWQEDDSLHDDSIAVDSEWMRVYNLSQIPTIAMHPDAEPLGRDALGTDRLRIRRIAQERPAGPVDIQVPSVFLQDRSSRISRPRVITASLDTHSPYETRVYFDVSHDRCCTLHRTTDESDDESSATDGDSILVNECRFRAAQRRMSHYGQFVEYAIIFTSDKRARLIFDWRSILEAPGRCRDAFRCTASARRVVIRVDNRALAATSREHVNLIVLSEIMTAVSAHVLSAVTGDVIWAAWCGSGN